MTTINTNNDNVWQDDQNRRVRINDDGTLTVLPDTDDYDEAKAALFRATQHLEQAHAEIASAEAFTETGTTGRRRNSTIRELKHTRVALAMVRRHADAAAHEIRH